jgi:hypothetical protein
MPDRLDEANKLTLVGCQFGVLQRHWPAIVSNGPAVLVKHHAKTAARCVTIDDERLVKIWELESWPRGECVLKCQEHVIRRR